MITKRAVLYVGYLCDISCKFCYYLYRPNKAWYSIRKCKNYALFFRYNYGNTSVDITGGEPTIYPDIFELVSYCRRIGLKPTIITNTQALADFDTAQRFKDAGIEDFLCSIHAWGDKYDNLVNKPGGFKHIDRALVQLNKLGIPFRVNCVLTKESMEDLTHIASYAYNMGVKVINFISYNPFYEGAQPNFQEKHSSIAPYLNSALRYCAAIGLEANVRYYPFCMIPVYPDTCYNFSQLSYDPGEWDFRSLRKDSFGASCNRKYSGVFSMSFLPFFLEEKRRMAIARAQRKKMYTVSPKCVSCKYYDICDGLTNQYFKRYGDAELNPISGLKIADPGYFVRNRKKYLLQKLDKSVGDGIMSMDSK